MLQDYPKCSDVGPQLFLREKQSRGQIVYELVHGTKSSCSSVFRGKTFNSIEDASQTCVEMFGCVPYGVLHRGRL
jgi:hypothetical protein